MSLIVLPNLVRRASTQKITFEIVGSSEEIATIAQDLEAKGVDVKVEEVGQQIEEGEQWLPQPDGSYKLSKCRQGFLLVNTTGTRGHYALYNFAQASCSQTDCFSFSAVDLQACKECEANSYSFSDSDACNQQVHPTICNARDCTACPTGAECRKGSSEVWQHFVPRPVKVRLHTRSYNNANNGEEKEKEKP